MPKTKGTSQVDAPRARSTSASSSRDPQGVRVWAEVGLTVAVTRDPPQFVRAIVGHERISPSDSSADLKRTMEQVKEYNEKELDKMLKQFRRLVKGETPEAPKSKVQARAKKRLRS